MPTTADQRTRPRLTLGRDAVLLGERFEVATFGLRRPRRPE
jgi:hypothetical protein